MSNLFIGIVLGSLLTTGIGMAKSGGKGDASGFNRTQQEKRYDYFRERQQQQDVQNIYRNQQKQQADKTYRNKPC
jgi:hypothetical protein